MHAAHSGLEQQLDYSDTVSLVHLAHCLQTHSVELETVHMNSMAHTPSGPGTLCTNHGSLLTYIPAHTPTHNVVAGITS